MSLFLISFASLFLELLLIRWIGTELRIFAYFKNLTLIACFLGLGLGFGLKKYQPGLFASLVLMLALAGLVHPSAEVSGVSLRRIPEYISFAEFFFWESPDRVSLLKAAGGLAMIFLVAVMLAGIFIPFGLLLGKIFAASENRIRDYSVNLVGSLLGTWSFAGLSYLNTPPWVWFTIASAGMIPFLGPQLWKKAAGASLLIPIILLTFQHDTETSHTFWSPYQKLQYHLDYMAVDDRPGERLPYAYLNINSVYYMALLDLSEGFQKKYPEIFKREEVPYYPYNLPFRIKPEPKRVLIVGAGAGNDAAAALRNNAQQIDAVEIDPMIAGVGRQYHPEKPYQNPRVNLIIDDARSFFKKSKEQYDLILFALLDSHTLTSNFTNISLDSYVYTLESFQEAKEHLAPGGVLALSFQVERAWLGAKLYSILEQVFHEKPLIIQHDPTSQVYNTARIFFFAGDMKEIKKDVDADKGLQKAVANRIGSAERFARLEENKDFSVPSDDWPYLYLQKKRIPTLYIIMIFLLVCSMLAAVKLLMPEGRSGPSHFLLLGAGFMLLEVHSISKAALLFGSTWIVNVVIISAILAMILLANLVTLRYRIERLRYFYAALFITLLLTYILPIQSLLFGNYFLRGIIAGTFYTLPMFFAGVIFACSIRKVAGVESAFAANMLGSTIGGMLESASFLLGIKAMVLLAVLLYAASAAALRYMPLRK